VVDHRGMVAAHDGQVARFPESRAQIGVEIASGQVGLAGHAFLQRLFDHPRADPDADFAQLAHRRINPPGLQMGGGGVFGQRVGRFQHHTVGHLTAFGQNGAETQPGENEGVVALADMVHLTVPNHIRKGAAGGDDGPTFAPVQDVFRQRFAGRGRIRQWENEGVGRVAGHGLHHRMIERAGLTAQAQQDGGFGVFDGFQQGRDVVGDLPAGNFPRGCR
jgi:hypothetical protein